MNNRDIDRLVAEHIFGWVDFWSNGDCVMGYPPSEQKLGIGYDERHNVPNYSTDILHAWMVVDKMRKVSDGLYGFELEDGNEEEYQCCFYGMARSYTAESQTAPLAICISALKTVGIEVQS